MSTWQALGTTNQQRLVNEAIAACDFPFDLLIPRLTSQTGKTSIPVVWSDLAVYGVVDPHTLHRHIHDDDLGVGHVVSPPWRSFVAGIAWSNGRIDIDLRCETINSGQLAREVFLAEAAHACDFYWLTPLMRDEIWKSLHGGSLAPHPGHDWFDVAYADEIGEAWMAGFVLAFSAYVPWQGAWSHKFTRDQARALRPTILPAAPQYKVYSLAGYRTCHRRTHLVPAWLASPKTALRVQEWPTAAAAIAAGQKACRICKP